MGDIAKDLGQRIRQLRCEHNMSQEELSFMAGISASHLGQIERAAKHPTVDTIGKIASALGVPISYLFPNENTQSATLNTTVEKINAHLSAMTEDEQKDILRIIRIFRGYQRKSDRNNDND